MWLLSARGHNAIMAPPPPYNKRGGSRILQRGLVGSRKGGVGYAGLRSSQQGGMQSSPKGVWGSAPAALQLSHFFKPQKHDTFVLTDNSLIHCICFRKQPMPSQVHSIVTLGNLCAYHCYVRPPPPLGHWEGFDLY